MKKNYITAWLLSMFTFASAQNFREDIPVSSEADIEVLRDSIYNYIWQNNVSEVAKVVDFEKDLPAADLSLEEYSWYPYLKSVDRFTVLLKNSIKSHIQVLHPKISNGLNIPIIYHGGHGGGFWEDNNLSNNGDAYSISFFEFFLKKGFDIVNIDMPLKAENYELYLLNRNNRLIFIGSHDDLFNLKEPLYYFMEPVRKTIDLLEKEYNYSNFAMVGLSGGGWTTTLYSAIDTRIKHSYSVAGSIPIPLRKTSSDYGDKEQYYTPFYDKFNYSTLYVLAAAGKNRLHYQILNKNDDCCFTVDGSQWVGKVKNKIKQMKDPGSYKFYYDTFATIHKISSVTLDTIYANLAKNFIPNNVTAIWAFVNNKHEKTAYICDVDSIVLAKKFSEKDSIQWFKDSSLLPEESKPSLHITSPGKYYAKLSNISGLSFFSDTISVTRYPRPQINLVGSRLYSNSDSRSIWFLNGSMLNNSNQPSVKPTRPGKYTVISTSTKCSSETSEPFYYGILVYPNPVVNEIFVQADNILGTVRIELFDVSGHLLLKSMGRGNTKIRLPANIGPGIHFLKLSNNSGLKEIRKILIQR